MTINYIILFIIIIIAFLTDIKKKIIPNMLTYSGITFGLIYHTVSEGLTGFLNSLLGMTIGFILLGIIYLFKAIGAGDVKLFAAIGALTNMQFVLQSVVYSVIYGGLIGIFIIIYKRKIHNYDFPFMLAILPGILTAYYYMVIL